jgi:hypothetical protein
MLLTSGNGLQAVARPATDVRSDFDLPDTILKSAPTPASTNPPFFEASHKNSAMPTMQMLQFAHKSIGSSWHINCKG